MTQPPKPPGKPSLKALEAAAMMRIAEMVQNSLVKPSEQAVRMAARSMALKAFKESQSN